MKATSATTIFSSKHLGNEREVVVWLPPSYMANPTMRFPTLYLQDGAFVLDSDQRHGEVKVGVDSWVEELVNP